MYKKPLKTKEISTRQSSVPVELYYSGKDQKLFIIQDTRIKEVLGRKQIV